MFLCTASRRLDFACERSVRVNTAEQQNYCFENESTTSDTINKRWDSAGKMLSPVGQVM